MDERLEGLTKFNDLIRDQFEYGGKKYALDTARESTDILFETHGKNWLFGTMDKYTYRFTNLARERDLLKIACYCYILWLKRGFFFKDIGLTDVIDTTVKIKLEHFPIFLHQVANLPDSPYKIMFDRVCEAEDKMGFVSRQLKSWSNTTWTDISSGSIYMTYMAVYLTWREKYANVERHDTDTYNETKPATIQR